MTETFQNVYEFGFRSTILIILLSDLPLVLAQQGFLSIACGAEKNFTDEKNITWFADANYIRVGRPSPTPNASSFPFEMRSFRFFPKPLEKSCYELHITPNATYLLRLTFLASKYTHLLNTQPVIASLEAKGAYYAVGADVSGFGTNTTQIELVFTSSSHVIYVCLTRGEKEEEDPFISAIELRQLKHGMYDRVKQGTVLLLNARYDFGAESSTRYPPDLYDRIWQPYPTDKPKIRNLSTTATISYEKTKDLPPSSVMKTAWLVIGSNYLKIKITTVEIVGVVQTSLYLLYFAEIQNLNNSESRIFNITVNGNNICSRVNVLELSNGTYDTSIEIQKEVNDLGSGSLELELTETDDSTRPPMINALEHYIVYPTDTETLSEEIEAFSEIQRAFGLLDWNSDPCYPGDRPGFECSKQTNSYFRVLNITLSRRNLGGSIPDAFGRLTALKNMFLDHNQLRGSLPNLSNLIHLEKLRLQNNSLSGPIPEWLSRLDKLKELNVENNSFSGIIPRELLRANLTFRYRGNPLLKMPSSPSNRWRVVLGLTLGGILVTILAFTLLLLAYRRKSIKKAEMTREGYGSSTKTSKSEGEDYSLVVVPNPTKSRAFTLDEMMAATHNFTQIIGKGGFGTVYYGILSEGQDVAVKVLSMFSRQGVQEFLNEVDLLSRVHHKNLVTLMGYCNESRELMLIYEYMSGGSLRDHLYVSNVERIKLDWKTRLQIALDAAQGLEYLQVKCTPKIIHRDVKTANILLDKDLTGKLADFGLSRTAMDAGATHITTTVKGTAGYLDPEYFSTHMLTEKSDVYSFGVVLFEIVCGRKPIDVKLPEEEINLIRWVTPYVEDKEPNRLAKVLDKRLSSNCDIKSVFTVANLAIRCVQADPASRPNISQIVAEIKEAIELIPHSDEIDIQYGDLSASLMCTSTESSNAKEMDTTDNSSNAQQ